MSELEKKDNSNSLSFMDFKTYGDVFSEIENEDTVPEQSVAEEIQSWDTFKYFPPKKEIISMQNNKWLDACTRAIKLFVYGILFCIVFCSSLFAKCTVLFSIAQLEEDKSVRYCDYHLDYSEEMNARMSKEGKIIWTWYIIFMFLVPECFNVINAVWWAIFNKRERMPKKQSIAILLLLETLHPIGLALLVFYSLPKINSVDAAAISSCIYFVPALLNLFSQNKNYASTLRVLVLSLSCLALLAQGSGMLLPYFLYYDAHDSVTWILPVSILLSSCRWWLNYVSIQSCCGFLRYLATVKIDLTNSRQLLQGGIAFWRSLIFISSAIVISTLREIEFKEFFQFAGKGTYNVDIIKISKSPMNALGASDYFDNTAVPEQDTSTALYAFLVQAFCAFFTFEAAKYAYKTHMHRFGAAFPINLTTPGAIVLLTIFSVIRDNDSCAFHGFIPDFLFFKEPSYNDIKDFLLSWRIYCWILWWLSQIWITVQLWLGENERIAPTEKIFYVSNYDSLIIDQFTGLNKRRHETRNIIEEEELLDSFAESETVSSQLSKGGTTSKKNICATQIYACATMWHERKEEMTELIGSILRLDKDQCEPCPIKDYYELERLNESNLTTILAHIFFDDAYCCMHGCFGSCDHNETEVQVNQYVKTFVETMRTNVESPGMRSLWPIKYPTPYGGQLVWILPGKTRLTVHLKDKNKIRHRKRWSQVMYMYYLLGYRLMSSSRDIDHKELMAENTYLLTLDGDIDFCPTAVKVLVDLMKKDKELGGACGRIHPIGKGPMVWFQKFEYAIGHWLQKSTEHVTGSVLCSPGCFSLFRAKALMQNNVLAKYATKSTKPRHYIQYDQGEDRWLCTLILQAGGRVEYCAASDAYTHAPESFYEFYNQRRRWIPSTIANMFDLLNTSKETRKVNNNISWLYVAYQWILMGSTIIGPSFLYLMMVGAFVETFHIDHWTSFWYNLIPLSIFLAVCFCCEERIQLITAAIMTVIYSLIMVVVLVGMILQVAAQGCFAPNTLLFFIVIGQFVLTGLMHPKEWECLNTGFVYYITVPSMYMLLTIFSIFNVHNVTWGTRESKVKAKGSKTQFAKFDKSQAEQDDEKAEKKWTISSMANLLKCNFGTHNASEKEGRYLKSIYNAINEINIRLEQMESNYRIGSISKEDIEEKSSKSSKPYSEQTELTVIEDDAYKNTDSESEVSLEAPAIPYQQHSNYLISPHWLQDGCIKNGAVDFLPILEEEFWKQLINKYLHPIDQDVESQKKITKGLLAIRNECLLKFFIINTLFVVAIFLLQINKDVLQLQWPFSITYNITYDDVREEVRITQTFMHLEPIGCLFIAAFVVILLIQFLAMFFHRFDTFTHILANVKLNLFSCGQGKRVNNNRATGITEGRPNAIDKETEYNFTNNIRYSRKRRTIGELVEGAQNTPKMSANFEVLFDKKQSEPAISGNKVISMNVPKDTTKVQGSRSSKINAKRKNDTNDEEASSPSVRKTSEEAKNYEYYNPAFLNDDDK